MTWTPERIAAAREACAQGIGPETKWSAIWEILALAEIGLSVVAPAEADVERVARAIAAAGTIDGRPDHPSLDEPLGEDMGEDLAGRPNWMLYAQEARAAIAAMGGGDDPK